MKKKIFIPSYLINGIIPYKNCFPRKYKVFACDVETSEGKPYLLVLFDGNRARYIEVTPETIADEFLGYLTKNCTEKNCSHIAFFHNMEFDLPAILTKEETSIFPYQNPPLVRSKSCGAEVSIKAQKTWFAHVTLRNGVRIKLVDSADFIKGSLHQISRKLNLKHKKRQRPKFVVEDKKPSSYEERKELQRYCCDEIHAEHDLAMFILEMHKKYDVGFSVSSSQLAMKVFRKHFLKETIPQALPPVRKLAELSLHGGRAGYFFNGVAVIPNVKMYDYNSFYSWAMANLPPLTKGEWVKRDCFVDEYEGFYLVSGYVNPCKYPIIIKDPARFVYANDEHIEDVVVSSYELREALKSKEFGPEKIMGWVWVPTEGAVNPFRDYVNEFYDLKQNTQKDNPMHVVYKLLLNQLYGKTYQTNRAEGYEEEPDLERIGGWIVRPDILFEAGGMYNPAIGAWITSKCRAKLHKDLHKHSAIDCATDSFKTQNNDVLTGEALGELKLVCKGLALIIRPKVYVMFSEDVQKLVFENYGGDLRKFLKDRLDHLKVEDGKDIIKNARHAFWGNVKDLLRMYIEKDNEYICKHMTKIRESIRQKKQPRVMETLKRKLKIDWENEIMPCWLTQTEAMKQKELCVAPRCYECAYVQEF